MFSTSSNFFKISIVAVVVLLIIAVLSLRAPSPPQHFERGSVVKDEKCTSTVEIKEVKVLCDDQIGVNIVNQDLKVPHHPIFQLIPRERYSVDEKILVELCGLKVPAHYDCNNFNEGHFWGYPSSGYDYYEGISSRWVQCNEYRAMVDSGIRYITPSLPIIDEEYVEHVSVYQSVARARKHYIVIELGARWGTWGSRAIAFARKVKPDLKTDALFIETLPVFCEGLLEVQKLNDIKSTLFCEKANATKIINWSSAFDHIDLMDFDIQGAESYVVPELKSFMDEKVYRVILGTHSTPIHDKLKELFSDWLPVWELPCNIEEYGKCIAEERKIKNWEGIMEKKCYTRSDRFGPIMNWDGELIFDNPKFVSRHKRFKGQDYELIANDLIGQE